MDKHPNQSIKPNPNNKTIHGISQFHRYNNNHFDVSYTNINVIIKQYYKFKPNL